MHKRTIIRNKDHGYAAIVGELAQNSVHAHYSLHLIQSLGAPNIVDVDGCELDARGGVVIGSWVPHAIREEPGSPTLIVSASPLGLLGQTLNRMLDGRLSCAGGTGYEPEKIAAHAFRVYQEPNSIERTCRKLAETIDSISGDAEPDLLSRLDPRIVRSLQLLASHTSGFMPAGAVADLIGLSESRFLHLFREQVGMTYRRMQRWVRLAASFDSICTSGSLTETAHEFGFSDSAHFSRAFHEAFGMAPSVLVNDSRFVQV